MLTQSAGNANILSLFERFLSTNGCDSLVSERLLISDTPYYRIAVSVYLTLPVSLCFTVENLKIDTPLSERVPD